MQTPDRPVKPWIRTPCLRSSALSTIAQCEIYLKLENLQPSGSFKSRGIGNLMLSAIKTHGPGKPIHFYCSSGGNAGLACAHAATSLLCPATIVVPLSTADFMILKLRALNVTVYQHGATWFEADLWLREELLAHDVNGIYVPPFDHEDVWSGNATMIPEIVEDVGVPDVVVCSVGGGGLINGVVQGLASLETSSHTPVKTIAVETVGADSLFRSVQVGNHIRLNGITSIATSLGATKVSEQTWNLAQDKERVTSTTVTDSEAVQACVDFVDLERILVEPACGASIALVFEDRLREILGVQKDHRHDEWAKMKVVLVVCGGSNISSSILEGYRQRYMADLDTNP